MLVLEPCAGLSNRILAIATAYQLARDADCELNVLWDIDGAVGVALQELFVLPQDIKVSTMTKLPYRRCPWLRAESDWRRHLLRKRAAVFLECGDVQQLLRQNRTQQLSDWMRSGELIYVKAFCELTEIADKSIFGIFTPSPEIEQKGKRIFDKIDAHTVGFHVRRTDHAEAIRRSPLSLFYDKAENILADDPNGRIFLATDDAGVESALREAFGSRIVSCPDKQFGRDDKAGMQDGLIDLLALSRCREIYGSFGSTFSRMASYLGNRELTVLQKEEEDKE